MTLPQNNESILRINQPNKHSKDLIPKQNSKVKWALDLMIMEDLAERASMKIKPKNKRFPSINSINR